MFYTNQSLHQINTTKMGLKLDKVLLFTRPEQYFFFGLG